MYTVEIYGRVRRAVLVEGKSERAVAQEFGIARETVRKMLRYAVPPGSWRDRYQGYRSDSAGERTPSIDGPLLAHFDFLMPLICGCTRTLFEHFGRDTAHNAARRGYVLKSDADIDLLAAVDYVRHRQPFSTNHLAHAMAQNVLDNAAGANNPGGRG